MDITQRITELTRPTGEEDLLHINYPKPRFEISMKHAIIVALVAVVGLAGWFVVKPAPEPDQLAWATEPALSGSPPAGEIAGLGAGAGTSTGSAPDTATGHTGQSQEVVVSVVGAVHNPGLVTLGEGARVADALDAAGLQPEADTLALNLAQVLTDGQQIVVTRVGEVPPAGAGAVGAGGVASAGGAVGAGGAAGQPVSINNASATELMELPGVGEATAAAIIAHREEVGGFSDIAQLQDVSGIGPAKFAKLEGEVVL